jgi:hypothetical protein
MYLKTDYLATLQCIYTLSLLTRFKIHAYGGVQPVTAAALAGNLGTPIITYQAVTANGDDGKYGLKWDTPVALSRTGARLLTQAAQGVGISSGNITYVVLAEQDDPLTASTSKARYIATIGTSGADIIVDSVNIEQGKTYAFTSPYTVTF